MFVNTSYIALPAAIILPIMALVLALGTLSAQGEINVLRAGGGAEEDHLFYTEDAAARTNQNFSFEHQLIIFRTQLDGKMGTYVLDTGAPRLLINHRGAKSNGEKIGIGAGGNVAITNQYVKSFRLFGREYRRNLALGMDMRAFEHRLDQPIDGFVGYDLLRDGELRIDYGEATFSWRKSGRRPLHAGRAPDHTFKLTFADHLPILTLRVGKRKLRLAIDTGASVNVLDERLKAECTLRDQMTDVQGLDGTNVLASNGVLTATDGIEPIDDSAFVLIDLNHLQSPGAHRIDGILGSPFLSNFTVGIDYRKGKLYLWNVPLQPK